MVKKIMKFLLKKYNKRNIWKHEKKKIKEKKNLIKKVHLSKTEIESINDIWIKNYGKKISLAWHKLYTSYTGNFNKYYFPEIFFTTNLLQKLNPSKRKKYLSDKVLTQYLFSNIDYENFKLIKTYVYNCNGYFYDDNRIYNIGRGSRKT